MRAQERPEDTRRIEATQKFRVCDQKKFRVCEQMGGMGGMTQNGLRI